MCAFIEESFEKLELGGSQYIVPVKGGYGIMASTTITR
jgi:hypothetical protein